MRYGKLTSALFVMTALCLSACSTSRRVSTKEQLRIESSEMRVDSLREQMVVAIHDTIREVTTITVDRNEAGDTLKVAQVTERDNIRNRSAVKDKHERIVVKTDTVFIAVRDSSNVKNTNFTNGTNKKSNFVSALKWIFWILVCVILMILIIKFKSLISLIV